MGTGAAGLGFVAGGGGAVAVAAASDAFAAVAVLCCLRCSGTGGDAIDSTCTCVRAVASDAGIPDNTDGTISLAVVRVPGTTASAS